MKPLALRVNIQQSPRLNFHPRETGYEVDVPTQALPEVTWLPTSLVVRPLLVLLWTAVLSSNLAPSASSQGPSRPPGAGSSRGRTSEAALGGGGCAARP